MYLFIQFLLLMVILETTLWGVYSLHKIQDTNFLKQSSNEIICSGKSLYPMVFKLFLGSKNDVNFLPNIVSEKYLHALPYIICLDDNVFCDIDKYWHND